MNEENSAPASSAPSPAPAPGKPKLIILLLVACLALAAVVWLLVARKPAGREVIVEVVGAEEDQPVYTSEVIDAITQRNIEAQVGHRYKVVVDDESREGTAGIARIGGLVTFIKDARVGDILIVEVIRLKKSSAEARIIQKLETAEMITPAPAREQRAAREPRPRREKETPAGDPVQVGGKYSGVVEEKGSKGDGIVRVGGKVVFIAGTEIGEKVSFMVTSDMGRFAVGERIEGGEDIAEVPELEAVASLPEGAAVSSGDQSASEDVQPGKVFDVVVTERDRKTPDVNGVARIGGLVVFVPNSQPGDEVRIRITDRKARFAVSEVIEHKGQLELKQ